MDRAAIHRLIYTGSVVAFAIALSFPFQGTNIITAILLLNWLVEGRLRQKFKLLLQQPVTLFTMGIFLVYMTGVLYAEDFIVGVKALEIKASILLLTPVIATSRTSAKVFHAILLAFAVGLLMRSAMAWYLFYNNYPNLNDIYLIIVQGFFRDNYTPYAGLHPTYFSLYIFIAVFGLIYLLSRYYSKLSRALIIILGLTISYFLVLSLLLSARMPMFSFVFLTLVGAVYYLARKRKLFLLGSFLASVIIAGFFFMQSELFNIRFKELQETDLSPPIGVHHNSTNIRVAIFECAFAGLKQKWLTGFGTGDVQLFLNRCYEARGYSETLYENNYGLHNAYLDIWLSVGILGLGILLAYYAFAIDHAIRHRLVLYLAFILMFGLGSLTESILNTNKGVAFFAFFNAVLAYHLPHQPKPVKHRGQKDM